MAKLTAQVKKQIEYALFLAAGQDDPHSVTITELCGSLSRLTDDNAELRAEIERMTPKFVAYEYLEAPDRREAAETRADALAQALREIADEIPGTWGEKFNAVQAIARAALGDRP